MKPNRRLRAVIAVGAALAALTGCGTTETSTSPGDNAVLSDVVWAPDGQLLAFTRFDGTYVVTPNGNGLQRVAESSGAAPAWSPARQELAVATVAESLEGSGSGQTVQLVDIASRTSSTLRGTRGVQSDPSWSPDGSRVAFVRKEGSSTDLYVVGRDGRGLRRLTRTKTRESAPAWSPDGHSIAFLRSDVSLVEIKADGAGERTLASVRLDDSSSFNLCCWHPHWSPDGKKIAVDLGAAITVIDVATGRQRIVARRGWGPEWSPDGSQVLFQGWEPLDCTGVAGICVPVRILGPFLALVDDAGGTTRIGNGRLAASLMGGSWSPDGRRIAFVLEEDRNRTIVLVDARSHKLVRLDV